MLPYLYGHSCHEKGKSLPYFTTHAELVRMQRERKAAAKGMIKGDAEWHGDDFVKQSAALAGGGS